MICGFEWAGDTWADGTPTTTPEGWQYLLLHDCCEPHNHSGPHRCRCHMTTPNLEAAYP
jgi:hypothetical protein